MQESRHISVVPAGFHTYLIEERGIRPTDIDATPESVLEAFEQEYRDKLRAIADGRTDYLTGIYNRQFFDETLDGMLQTLDRYGTGHRSSEKDHEMGGITIGLVDLDDFKQYNDTLGHHVGDLVLRGVADAIVSNVRRGLAFRLGGDEFGYLLVGEFDPEVNTSFRIRSAVKNIEIEGVDDVGVTQGVLYHDGSRPADRNDLMVSVDDLLYQGKHSGNKGHIIADEYSQIHDGRLTIVK